LVKKLNQLTPKTTVKLLNRLVAKYDEDSDEDEDEEDEKDEKKTAEALAQGDCSCTGGVCTLDGESVASCPGDPVFAQQQDCDDDVAAC